MHLRRAGALALASLSALVAAPAAHAATPTPTPVVTAVPTPAPTPPPLPQQGVYAVSPLSGPAAGGTVVNVELRYLTGSIFFGTKQAEVISQTPGPGSSTVYAVKAPAGTAGETVSVSSGLRGARAPLTPATYTYDDDAAQSKRIDTVSPAHGPVSGGTSVAIMVRGTVSSAAVARLAASPLLNQTITYDQTLCPAVVGIDCYAGPVSIIKGSSPAAYASGPTSVNVVDGGHVLEAVKDAVTFTYDAAQPFGIVGAPQPSSGPASGGNEVTLWLTGPLDANAIVRFGEFEAHVVSIKPLNIQCLVAPCPTWQIVVNAPGSPNPSTRVTQTVSVQANGMIVGNAVPGGDAPGYTYEPATVTPTATPTPTATATPTITPSPTVTPTPTPVSNAPVISGIGGSGLTGVGGILLVRGTKLTPTTGIRVGSKAAIALYKSPTLILAFVPSLPKSQYPVSITTKAGTAIAPTKYAFN